MRRIALTGGIATGKSHVRARFEELGVPTIDSDVLAHRAVAAGSEGLAAVVARFGPTVLDSHGQLDRRRMADIVFSDPAARKALEAIIHPEVQRQTNAWFAALDSRRHAFAIADIPLLYEVNRERDFEAVIVAACHPDVQLRRLMERDRLSEADARRRIEAQFPIEEKIQRADFVIRTDGSYEDTNQQVDALARQLGDQRPEA
jgi:dephospho-CoA kinase